MTASELRDRLHALRLPGVFTADGGKVRWRFRAEGIPSDVDPQDDLWDVLCEVRARLDGELPPGWRRQSGWADGDSAGFDVTSGAEP